LGNYETHIFKSGEVRYVSPDRPWLRQWPISLSLDFLVDKACVQQSTSALAVPLTDTALYDQRPGVPRRRSKYLKNSLPSEVTSSMIKVSPNHS